MRIQPLVARFCLWLLGLLLHLLPGSFRRDYGEEMRLVFRDLLQETEERGWFKTAAVALWSVWDVAQLVVREHWQTFLSRHNLRGHPCTPRARVALAFAGQEAVRLGSPQCGDAHILLGLLREGGGVAAIALQRLGMEADAVRSEIERCDRTTPGSLAPAGRMPEILASARTNAVGLGHAFVGTEHVLLGMLASPQHSLETVLQNLGLSCEQIRREALAALAKAPNAGPMNVPQGGGSMTPAIKATVLVAMLLPPLLAGWLLLQASGHSVPPHDAAPGAGAPNEQDRAGIVKGQPAAEAGKYRVEEVRIPLKGTRPLKGTIVVPIAAHRVAAMLLIPGYGRDDGEASPRPAAPEEAGVPLGRYLAEHGIAVLRVPFGSGPTGNEPDLSLNELADRALQCVEYLKGRAEIDPRRIGIFGHSAGGGVAILAASRSSDLAFLAAAASPVESVESTVFAMLDGVLRAGGATVADRTAARDLQQRVFDSLAKGAKPEEVRPDLEKLFRSVYARFPKDHPALAGKNPEDAIKNAAERQLKTLTSPWFRGLLGFDPAAALAKIHCPALILFAEKDPKIDARKSRDIAWAALEKTGQKGFDVQVIPGADHSFEVQTAGATATDREARQRFSLEFLRVLSSWLVARSGGQQPTKRHGLVAADDDYVKSIRTFLQDGFPAKNACIVVGLVDEHESVVIAHGELADGTGRQANGDSLFLIGSVTKTFTTLLLQDMVKRGEMKLDDPVAKYLPASVKMPTHGGKEITLLDLATHTAGFPINPDNMTGKDVKEQYETYTVEKMYAFLSGYTLCRDPGSEFEYSNVGMALLGHVIALKAGTDFESLLVGRICRPLRMDSTCVRPTPALKTRLAVGRDQFGRPSRPWRLQVYAPAGSVHSTANDLLKYVSAHAGLTSSDLVPLMEKTHAIRHTDSRGLPDVPGSGTFGQTAMAWFDRGVHQPPGMQLLGHAGGSGSYHAYAGFDRKQHRGVVVLTTANDFSAEAIGWTLLQRKPLTRESSTVFPPVLELVGVGIALDLNEQTRTLRITKVLPNSPAAQAGLSPGLIMRRIGNVPLEGKSLAECLKLLRGDAGTKVRLELLDPDGKSRTVELTRKKILIAR